VPDLPIPYSLKALSVRQPWACQQVVRLARALMTSTLTPRELAWNRYGISRKMAIEHVSLSMRGTTVAIHMQTGGSASNSSGQENPSSYEQASETPSLFGENSSTTAAKQASTAPFSETKARANRQSLSDRLTQSLISSGLVRGITHTSIRKQCGAVIRATALWPLDGGNAE
jgi:hypothetical protein